MAAAAAVKEALWLRKLLVDFDLPLISVLIHCDNQSAIKLLKHPIASARSKHIDVIHHFARERVARSELVFDYCRTDEMVTKPLPVSLFRICREGLCVRA
jgi:hypothetical protein